MRSCKAYLAAIAIISAAIMPADAGSPFGPTLYPSFSNRGSVKYLTFMVTGATYTQPVSIDSHGVIYGNYQNAKGLQRGFIRQPNGVISTFGIKTSTGAKPSFTVIAANNEGQLIGKTPSTDGTPSGSFLRNADGGLIAIEGQVTGINDNGDVTGWGTFGSYHSVDGFVRKPDGTYVIVFPHTKGKNQYTVVTTGINNDNNVVGYFLPYLSSTYKAFLDHDNHFSGFSISGSTNTRFVAINAKGAIAGYYLDSQNHSHDIRRSQSGGIITTFDPPNSQGDTQPFGINNKGTIVGYFSDGTTTKCFTQTKERAITVFIPPHATWAGGCSINDDGTIAGQARDKDDNYFGFVTSP